MSPPPSLPHSRRIREDGRFTAAEASETMVRGWHLTDWQCDQHRMVGHTVLIMARRLALGKGLELRRIKTFKQEDMDIHPKLLAMASEQHGQREPTIKRQRRLFVNQGASPTNRGSAGTALAQENSPTDDEQQA